MEKSVAFLLQFQFQSVRISVMSMQKQSEKSWFHERSLRDLPFARSIEVREITWHPIIIACRKWKKKETKLSTIGKLFVRSFVRSTCSCLNYKRVWHFSLSLSHFYHYFNKPIPISFTIYNNTNIRSFFRLCRILQLRNLSQRSHRFPINIALCSYNFLTVEMAATVTTATTTL